VDTLYQVITASQADNLIDFTAEWKRSLNGIINALKEVDDETREILRKMFRSLIQDLFRAPAGKGRKDPRE
jgi:hypothetical protein